MPRPYKRKLRPEADRGTWAEVIYWLRKRSTYYKRRALHARPLNMVRVYRIHSEICEAVAHRLEYEINLQCYLKRAEGAYDNSADNPQLSAHSIAFGDRTEGKL